MDAVQELIDEHRDQLPVGLCKRLLDACMEARRGVPKLYRVTLTELVGVTCGRNLGGRQPAYTALKMVDQTSTLIVETFNVSPFVGAETLRLGRIPAAWVDAKLPLTLHYRAFHHEAACVIHAIEPYRPRARAEEEEEASEEEASEEEASEAGEEARE